MMIYLILLTQVLFVAMAFASRTNPLLRRTLIVFNAWWALLIVLSGIAPYGGYRISTETYLLIWLFILVFNTIYIFTKPARKKWRGKNMEASTYVYSEDEISRQYDQLILKNKFITIALYFITFILVYYAIKYSTIMSIGSFLDARNERFYVGGLFGTTIELLFYNYVISAFRYLFSFVIAFSLLYNRIKTKHFLICVLDLALYAYIGASRFPVILLLVNIFFLWIIRSFYNRRKMDGRSIGRLLKISLIFFAGIFGMSYLTAFRRGVLGFNVNAILDNFSILYQQILGYSVGPLSGLSYLLDTEVMVNHWFLGRAVVLNGFDELITYILSFVGIHISCAKNVLGAIANVQYHIGSASLNALFTCIYWFFSDFGYVGVVLFTGIFAWVEKKAVSNFVYQPNIFSLMLAIHVLYFLFMSNMIWQINNVDSLLYILMIYLLYKRGKKLPRIGKNANKPAVRKRIDRRDKGVV